MITSTLDSICRRVLLRKRVGLHYYCEALIAATNILRTLTLDELNIVNVKRLTVNGSNRVAIDGDVADLVNVYHCHNYGNIFLANNRYKINISTNELEFYERLYGEDVIVSYIDDGRNADAASHVHVYAEETIEAYILWQFAEMSRAYSGQEKMILKQEYFREREILRARLNDMDLTRLRQIVNRVKVVRPNFIGIQANVGAPATNNYTTLVQAPTDMIQLPKGADNYTVPAGNLLEIIVVLDDIGRVISVGSAPGVADIVDPVQISDGKATLVIEKYYPIATSVWINGVSQNSITKIYKR